MCLRMAAYLVLAALAQGRLTMAYAQTDPIGLRATAERIHDATLKDLGDGSCEIVTTGPDPYVFLVPTGDLPKTTPPVLAFEYASPTGTDNLQVYVTPPIDEAHSVVGEGLALSEGWSSHSIDLSEALAKTGGRFEAIRLDPGSRSGRTIRLRAVQLREPTARERELEARRESRQVALQQQDARLAAYLQHTYPCALTRVHVEADWIRVEGERHGVSGDLYLAEAPISADITDLREPPSLVPLKDGDRIRIRLPRRDGVRDRLLSRWVVVQKTASGFALMSHARYPDSVQPIHEMPLEKPRTKKGLGGFSTRRGIVGDLDDLGISAVTVNIWLNGLFRAQPGPGRTPFEYGGRTWYADDRAVARYDATLRETAKRRIVVSAILLLNQVHGAPDEEWARWVAHPDAHPSGLYVMPNMDSPEGLLAYAAALDFLAKRYGRPDNRHGRIHHWILHNEVDAGWVWTNAGEKTALLYMDLYHRSMRTAHLIARQYDRHARAFISLTHHWAKTPEPRFYPSKQCLELLLRYSQVEGDFEWAVAFHPYPDSLLVPRTWEDGNVSFSLDSSKITFRNIEVLDAWARQKSTWFQGRHRRTIHLSEQGLNSPDYSEKALTEQAAGMAYAWSKIKHLDSIEAFQYHAWTDNRGEFGLRLGLRKFPDDETQPLERKPIWFVYEAMGTDREEEVFAPYKAVVGIRGWREVRYRGPIGK